MCRHLSSRWQERLRAATPQWRERSPQRGSNDCPVAPFACVCACHPRRSAVTHPSGRHLENGALLMYSDVFGTGCPASCPVAPSTEVTPPNAPHHLVVGVHIAASEGRIWVSPSRTSTPLPLSRGSPGPLRNRPRHAHEATRVSCSAPIPLVDRLPDRSSDGRVCDCRIDDVFAAEGGSGAALQPLPRVRSSPNLIVSSSIAT